ncbi:hypothetical protein ACXDJA_002617 [Klebsiella variicola]
MKKYRQYFLHCNGNLVHVFKKNYVPSIEDVQNVLIDRVGFYGPAVRQSCDVIGNDLKISNGLNGIYAHLEVMERPD